MIYTVEIYLKGTAILDVEAGNKDEAIDSALDQIEHDKIEYTYEIEYVYPSEE
jgi:hypothetical protein